ncbi:interferon-inducible GTPase 5-like [Rhincodon typus]|uniref:interferon-inducible GTPase 5-like n=1 Tax=Rhincodon typus TaxID=259920 RepID=UPI00202EB04A|nr:interferon-inducible GTPase 5-like [Rhincodon typus]
MGSWISSKRPDAVWIAVTGPPAGGKTSLIQALRGEEDMQELSTSPPKYQYNHPRYPNVTFWEFKSNYLSCSKLDPYDILIIVSSVDQFASEDVNVAKEAQTKDKPCYFVRTNIDKDSQRCASTFSSINDLNRFLDSITSACVEYLSERGAQPSSVFLVSNTTPEIYQFSLLQDSLEKKIKELNRAQGCTERPGLDLAVFGDRWSGKSSLINAVRGLQTDDEGAAKVGQQEPCTQPVVYSFPRYSNVRIWELPPIRPNVQPEQYLKEVNGKDYEIIIIIASEIFKDHHGQLAKTLQDMGKKVLFVRNKIESDLAAYKRRHKSDYKESKFLKEIREFCVTCLCKEGVLKPTVYILSNLDIEKFQFQLLWSQIKNHPEMIKGDILDRVDHTVRDSLKEAFEVGGLPDLISQILSFLSNLDDITVNVGVIGEAGAGKSSLVNALCGVSDNQPGAAATGATETTLAPTSYPHHTLHHVLLWDLPGLGTPNFQLESYREKVGFHRYDFFIIVASERFKESHAILAKWIQESGAHFYFVRSKIDNDITPCWRKQAALTDQHEVKNEITEEAVNYLTEQGVLSPQVFLISCRFFEDYDSKQLQETLKKELPKFRKQAFLKSIHPLCSRLIAKRKDSLSAEVWMLALISSCAAAVPVPGVALACDATLLNKKLPFYYKCFGLDEESLKRMSAAIQKPLKDLRAQMRSPQVAHINISLLYKSLSSGPGMGLMAGEYLIRGFPVFGPVASGGIAFTVAKWLLTGLIQGLAADAERVLQWVIQSQVG